MHKKLSVTEKIKYPYIAFSEIYFERAMEIIDNNQFDENQRVRANIEKNKSIVFRRLILEYYIFFLPLYTLYIVFTILSGLFLQLLYYISFKKIDFFKDIYLNIIDIPVRFEIFILKKLLESGFISDFEYQKKKEKLMESNSKYIKKLTK